MDPLRKKLEAFRWIGDLTVLEAIESRLIDINNFYFKGDNYRYYFDVEAKQRFLELLKEKFNSGIKYKGKTWKWDTIVLNKTQELSRFLLEKTRSIDFIQPFLNLKRSDSFEIRKRILELSQEQANKLELCKSTFWNLKKKANSSKLFKIYSKTKECIIE